MINKEKPNQSFNMLRRYTATSLTALIFVPLPLLAQTGSVDAMMPDGVLSVENGGWSAWSDVAELAAFAVDAAVTLLLAALIAHHPVRRRDPPTLQSVILPRLFYIYALIGMAVGFLVVNHGAVIGFVVFGIGALLRFRSNMDDPLDTVEMILVTVLGLCVGMNLPIMAVLIGLVAWLVILFVGRHVHFLLTIKADDNAQVDAALTAAETVVQDGAWRTLRTSRSHSKPEAEMLIASPRGLGITETENALSPTLDATGANWKIVS
ncbi:MAG: hypothetical protein LJE62_01010 [Silicimonas sp.]|nr:hypothetical protein [Silicimonas sp.]